jgi:CRP-like cAMP-binding protein
MTIHPDPQARAGDESGSSGSSDSREPAGVPPEVRQACPLFQDMTKAELKQVLLLLEAKSYPQEAVILREGRQTQILWILAQGQCEVVKSLDHDGQQRLATLEAGAVFGEMSFFRPAPHSASVRALSPVQVFKLPREGFDELVQTGSSAAYRIAVNLNRVLAERLARMDEWICDVVEASENGASHREEWQEFRSRLYSDWQF